MTGIFDGTQEIRNGELLGEYDDSSSGNPSAVAFVVILVLFAAVSGLIAGLLTYSAYHRPAAPVVYEDQPGWNCRTMGNHVCGKVKA